MQTVTINFTASGQMLTGASLPISIASNTVEYVKAKFALGSDWTGFDSVRAIWYNDYAQIATVLDGNGECTVPWEVLAKTDDVRVNLVGSDVESDALVDRLTSYPVMALEVDATARIDGTETAPVTPSQFEQYIAIVEQLVGSVKDIDHTTLNADYTLTIYYTDGTSDTVGPIRGAQGETGNGILSAVLNPDYTLTLNYTNGQHDTVGPIRGATGETGNGIQSIYLTGTSGAVKTYTILFTDGNTTEFQVTDGEVTNAVLESLMPTDTANGSIASFPDGQNVFPLKSLVAEINPIQDLHGYDSPWVGGAGKNKLDFSLASPSGATLSGTASNFTITNTTDSYNFVSFSVLDLAGKGTFYFSGSAERSATTPNVVCFQLFYNDGSNHYQSLGRYEDDNKCTATDVSISVPSGAISAKIQCYSNNYNIGGTGITATFKNVRICAEQNTTYSPYENICPISGTDEVGVVNGGVNLFNGTFNTLYKLPQPIAKDTYVCASCADSNSTQIFYYDSNGTQLDYWSLNAQNTDGRYYRTFMISQYLTADAYYIKFANGNPTDLQLEIVDNANAKSSPYQAPISHTTTLPSTVYGGTLDVVSGELTVDKVSVTYDGSDDESWAIRGSGTTVYFGIRVGVYGMVIDRNVISNEFASVLITGSNTVKGIDVVNSSGYNGAFINVRIDGIATVETLKTYLAEHPLQAVYELATPTTVQLTPTQVQTLLGTNNIFADSGDVSVEYVADIQRYIDKKLAEL